MLLPHEIVASFYTFKSVNLFGRLTGPPGDPWLQMVFQTYSQFWCQATLTAIGQITSTACCRPWLAFGRVRKKLSGTANIQFSRRLLVTSCFFLIPSVEKFHCVSKQHPRWNGLITLSRCVCLEMVVSLKVAFIYYFLSTNKTWYFPKKGIRVSLFHPCSQENRSLRLSHCCCRCARARLRLWTHGF